MADNQYLYEVARIRTKELSLLSADFFEQLLSAPDYETCIRLLREKGWEGGQDDWEEMLARERRKTWELMEELLGDTSVFNVFLYANDYSNLKAAVKSCRHRTELSNIYIEQGTVPADTIRKALSENRFEELPEAMQAPAREAQKVLLQTGDGQLCDILIDRAALEAIYKAGKDSGDLFLMLYAELTVACADIKTAVRACSVQYDLHVKHTFFYNRGDIDVGIEIIPMHSLMAQMSTGIAWYENELTNIVREGRSNPTVPIILIGIEPD